MIGHSLLTLVPGASGAGSEWYARDLVVVSRGTSRPEVCGDAARYVDPLSSGDIAEGIEDVLRPTHPGPPYDRAQPSDAGPGCVGRRLGVVRPGPRGRLARHVASRGLRRRREVRPRG